MFRIGFGIIAVTMATQVIAQEINTDDLAARAVICTSLETETAQAECIDDIAFSMRMQLGQCTEIESDTPRLECYDIAAKRPEPIDITPPNLWSVRIETSEMTDESDVYIRVESENYVSCGFSGRSKPTLIVRCLENTTAVMISTTCHLADLGNYGVVTYRLDDRTAQTRRFRASSNNNSLGLWNGGTAIPFVKGMLDHDTMLARITPYGDNWIEPRFPIAGLNDEIAPLREACHW